MSNFLLNNKKTFNSNVKELFETIFKVLRNSYGPLGGNTLIHNHGDMPILTKDGLTIIRSFKPSSRSEFDIYALIKTISENLVHKVGDGSTSAIILGYIFYTVLSKYELEYKLPMKSFSKKIQDIQEALQTTIEVFLTKKLEDIPYKEDKLEILTKVASISNNNDTTIGRSVAEVMINISPENQVKVVENPHDNTNPIKCIYKNGFITEKYRLSSPIYFTGAFKDRIELTMGAYVIMTYNFFEVHYNYLLNKIIPSSNSKPIVIITETVQQEVKAQIIKDALIAINNNTVPRIFLIESGGLDASGLDNFIDLESYVGANASSFNYIGESESEPDIDIVGFAHSITFLPNNEISFMEGAGYKKCTKNYLDRVSSIKEELLNLPKGPSLKRAKLRVRLNRMEGVNATIYVGGRTQEEKDNLKYLVEDSVLACASVTKYGYTIGGNYALLHALYLLLNYKRLSMHKIYKEYLDSKPEYRELMDSVIDKVDYNILKDIYKSLCVFFKEEWDRGKLNVGISDITANIDIGILPVINLYNGNIEEYNIFEHSVKGVEVLSAVNTDTEILNSALTLNTLLLSVNQHFTLGEGLLSNSV